MRARRWMFGMAAASALLLLTGCPAAKLPAASDEVNTPEQPPAPSADDFAGKSPAEIQDTIDAASTQADQVAELLASGINYHLRLKGFRRHVDTAAAAATALIQHAETTDAQRQQTTIARMQIYYTAAKTDRAGYGPRLAEDVQKLLDENPNSQAAIVGEAMLLELTVLSSDAPQDEKLAALAEFAQRRPSNPAAPALFAQYGAELEKDDPEAALECYRAALSRFPNSPQLSHARAKLAALQTAEYTRLAKEVAHREQVASIKRKLVSRDGYFVIYSHEKNKTMYRFEYDVLEGADAAVNHILRVPKDWDWEVTARFPPSSDGYTRAMKLAAERVKKETFMMVPML